MAEARRAVKCARALVRGSASGKREGRVARVVLWLMEQSVYGLLEFGFPFTRLF